MSILDRHIGRSILTSTALVFSVLLALFVIIAFVEVLGDVGKADFGLGAALRYVLLSLPRNAYELFPMAALLGTTLGLAALAADSELIVMRAAGVSLLRIVGAVLRVGALFVLAALFLGEVVAPVTEDLAERGRALELRKSVRQQKDFGLWLRDGPDYVHLGEVLPDLSLLRVNIYRFGADGRLQQHTAADGARYEEGRWRLQGVRKTRIEGQRAYSETRTEDYHETRVAPDMLAVFAVRPEGLSALHLYRYLRHLELNKQDTGRYALAFWHKLVLPLATGVMVVLAVPFVFGQLRSSGVGARLLVGILLGLGFYVFSRGFGYFGLLHGVPPVVGAVLPSALFLALALYLLRRVA
jgi:lipopolysaccharide export system permease protein